ncbi:vicilin-like seed storage protein At2g18540 [Miscanthus floridulus]|uniref:vicilin-like seed storage protein At2g18540 n=1 Tax=Miscanthus floridulus TaxID=154761 RepID=UPI0034593989
MRYTVYIAEQSEQHLEPPQIPDIKSSDESEGNISPDEKSDSNEDDEQRLTRLKKNKLKARRRNRAKQRKQVWNKYKSELTEYNRKKEREAAKSTRRGRIEELTKELYTLTNNGKAKEDHIKEVGGSAKQPDEEVPQEPREEQSPRKSIFQRIEPVESADVNGRQEYYSKQQERGKPESRQCYQEISRKFDKEDDYGESEWKEDMSYYRRAVQISEKLQDIRDGKKIAMLANELKPDEIQVPAKKPSNFAPPKEAATKTIDLLTGDPEKTAIISANLNPK